MIKTMDETMGPFYYDCPKRILKMLSPTDNEAALEWRRKCAESGKKPGVTKLPVGTRLRLKNYHKPGEWIVKISKFNNRRRYVDWDHRVRFTPRMIEYYGYEVLNDSTTNDNA